MTKTLEALVEATGRMMAEVRPGEVCAKCKDNSTCDECAFQPPVKNEPTSTPTKQIRSSSVKTRKPRPRQAGGSYDFFKGLLHPIKRKQKV